MKKIAFFLSAQEIDKKYSEPALELVRQVIKSGFAFVYGGSERGLMKLAAAEATKLNGRIIAVSSAEFAHVVIKTAYKTIIAQNIPERIKIILEESDAIIALPGGSGTLDEITAVIEGKKLNLHFKPIILFNTQGFWNGLIEQYEHMRAEGFLNTSTNSLFFVSDKPKEVLKYVKNSLI